MYVRQVELILLREMVIDNVVSLMIDQYIDFIEGCENLGISPDDCAEDLKEMIGYK